MKGQVTIGVVDDDDIYQFTIKRTMELLNLAKKVHVFSDGEEALDFILENVKNVQILPDIILLDINMPIMDGFQFMEEYVKIKNKSDKKIKIYMVSSSVDPVDMEKAKKIKDICDYIIKPIWPDQLTEIVSSMEKIES